MGRCGGSVAAGFLVAGVPVLGAGYSGLVAVADGSAVFFQVKTGFYRIRSYQVRIEQGRPVVRELAQPVVDSTADKDLSSTRVSFATREGTQTPPRPGCFRLCL